MSTSAHRLHDRTGDLAGIAPTGGQQVVLKLSSWETVDAVRLVDLLPDAPFVFVHRPVDEVVASELHRPPGWSAGLDVEALSRWVPHVAGLPVGATTAEVYAALWASEVAGVLGLERRRVLVVAYADLVGRPDEVLAQMADHLGVGPSWQPKAAASELRYYAKDTNPSVAFDPSGEHASPAPAEEVAERVAEVVGDLPEQLANR